jgi:integrase
MPEKRVTVWVQRFKDRPHLVLQWLDPDTGRRKSKSAETADPKEAEARRVDLEADLNNGRYQEASRMTWERFRQLFEAEYVAPLREGTRLLYGQTLDLFEALVAPQSLRAISERTVSRFAAALRQKPNAGKEPGLAPITIKRHLQFLRTALNWAVGQKLLPARPRFPSVKVPRRKPQPVPAESFEKMADRAPDAQTRAFLLCGWLAGLRLAEAYTLSWEPAEESPYLDLDRDRIILPAGFVKSVEDQWLPLDAELREALEALPRHGPQVFRFLAPDGHPICVAAVSRRIVRLARLAGVKLTMRSLRRGFGCFYAARQPAQVLQKLMRHANIKTTMDYYANVDDAVEAAVKSKRNSLCNRPPEAGGRDAEEVDANPCRDGGSVNDSL